jgi:hypothetical protein
MWRLFLVGSLLAGLTGVALANGRAPGTSTINFRKGMENHIVGGMTFGVVKSIDGGATWTWQCEDAVGYGGNYDPDYAFAPTGSLFATTFDGLKVNRDGCVYEASTLAPAPPAIKFFSAVTVGPDGAIYAANTDAGDGKVYKSIDDGATFPISTTPGPDMTWWQSIEVAPSNASVVYLAGYRVLNGQPKEHFLRRSANGGESFAILPVTDFGALPANATIELAGILKTNADVLYVRITLFDNTLSDALFRSTNGGQNWTKILELQGSISFVVRGNGDLVAGTQALGSFVSTNQGADWTPLANAPHINCLAESSAGEVWACTQNYGSPTVPSDEFGIMKTTDLTTWTGVLKFQDLVAPETCPAGSVQKDQCDAILWCGLCAQLGCQANRDCEVVGDAGPGVDTTLVIKDPSGCCQSGSDGIPGLLALGVGVGMVLARRRRRS